MTFDGAARTYDHDFSQHRIAQYLRGRVWARLDRLFSPGMRVLELGCGTGQDAIHLAQRGVEVIASDASTAMLAVTERNAQAHGITLQTLHLDFNQPATWQVNGLIEGVYSNFGALNCTDQWATLGDWLGQQLPPGAPIGVGVMGRFCLWESLWHGMRGNWRTATRRWGGKNQATLPDGTTFSVYYPTARTFAQALSPAFDVTDWVGMGILLPTSDSYGAIETHPRLERWLTRADSWVADKKSPLRGWADHFWMELKRRG
jgi:trans-aconitate methyltransferase